MKGRLFVTPILNTMGPVKDSNHSDLLTGWEEVDKATERYFSDNFRNSLIDSREKPVVISWFLINWTGFTSNPVNRDFGWFTIYDHIVEAWGSKIKHYGDGIYWMYNHPDKSGIGNVWGLDWLENTSYLEILNKFILERNFFPGVIEIPTCDTHTCNFLENFFPFNLSNRNSSFINWDNIEADGKRTRDIIKWASAPKDWSFYHPSEVNHQLPGHMKQFVFRLLDIKTRIMEFPDEEVNSAFELCRKGYDAIIAGYEHDFRDRSQIVEELFLKKIKRIWEKDYSDIQVINDNFQNSIRNILGFYDDLKPEFFLSFKRDYLCISSNCNLFNSTPYVVIHNLERDVIYHHNPTKTGLNNWAIEAKALPEKFIIGIGAFGVNGIQHLCKYRVICNDISRLSHTGNIIPM